MIDKFIAKNGTEFAFIGPGLEKKSCSSVFYFALSNEDSLTLDPYNQPVMGFSKNIRVLSVTLPLHEGNQKPQKIGELWAKELLTNPSFLDDFLDKVAQDILSLGIDRVAFMGLSRGVWVACQLAVKVKKVSYLLGFAPMTQLPGNDTFDLVHLAEPLSYLTTRMYIGNNDTRVNTDKVYQLNKQMVSFAAQRSNKPIPIELMITPSLGYMGHGTSKTTFLEGATWLEKQIT